MKTLQRTLNITFGAVITCWLFGVPKIEAGIYICLMLITILPMAAKYDEWRNENK